MELNTRIKNYWEGEAEVYSEGIRDELDGFEKQAWLELVLEYAPKKDCLDILDIGTGPGFFPIILSKAGHHVTGIDITENMIHEARENLAREGVEAHLETMDCQQLDYADESFDLLVCRNLTWTLNEPEKAYREWKRVLRPGGRLLVFDACWYLHLYDPDLARRYNEKEEEVLRKYGRPIHQHADQQEGDALSRQLFMSDKKRPEWDMNMLFSLGFSKVFADQTVGERTSRGRELELAEIHKPFLVGGEK